jgi:DNA mismatch endonuclease (patch repair protein)
MAASTKTKRVASFAGLTPASVKTSRIASRASRKKETKCEVALQEALRELGLQFKTNVSTLPGCPDLVFERERIAVFVDGDFWHGRNFASRAKRLSKGHNSEYWIQKIQSNMARDRRVRRRLRAAGWRVIRVWEGTITSEVHRVVRRVVRDLKGAMPNAEAYRSARQMLVLTRGHRSRSGREYKA